MGLLGFKVLQNIQELIYVSNNDSLFFLSEADLNTHEEYFPRKQLSGVMSEDPTDSFSLDHPLFIFFCQSCSQTFSSFLLCIPSRLPIFRKLPASHLWLPTLVPHPPSLLCCQQPTAPASSEYTRGSELQLVQPSRRGSPPHTGGQPHFPLSHYSEAHTQKRPVGTLPFTWNTNDAQGTEWSLQ